MVAIKCCGSLDATSVFEVSTSACVSAASQFPPSSRAQVWANIGQEPTSSQLSGMGMAATRSEESREAGSMTA